jgi:CBS domain-containing protein
MTTRTATAQDLMTQDVIGVEEDMSVAELAQLLLDAGVSGAVVRDAEGKVSGVVSLTDVARAAVEEEYIWSQRGGDFYLTGWEERYNAEDLAGLRLAHEGQKVADIMSPTVYAVEHDAPASHIADVMLSSHIHRVLVTRDGEVAGIVSTSDLLRLLVD